KEKFYIPKNFIERYNNGEEVLYFNITEQEAKDFCMKNTPPSEDEAKHIVQTITENRRSSASKKEEEKQERESKTEEKMIVVAAKEKKKDENHQSKKISKTNRLSRVEVGEEEIVEKMKIAANDLKHIIISGAKVAKEKIKERREIGAEKQAHKDAEKISKMGDLATQFTNSFEDILSEIRTRTYTEQEQIYTGFLKLIEQQRGLLIARRDLATKLKSSVQKPVVTRQRSSLVGKEQPKVSREPELPLLPPPEPQLPEVITASTTTNTTITKKGLRTKPLRNEVQMKESPIEQITSEPSLRSSAATTEPSYTEIPSAEIPTKKQKTSTIDDVNSAVTKRKNKRPKGR
ncbi:MAG: hypothetical protein JO327_07310, partial [Nitrososphaeraceae archaeon]|nr:hypothetical protein [Nitrososphaeraceae archaeon]